jgi:hypothetical protein
MENRRWAKIQDPLPENGQITAFTGRTVLFMLLYRAEETMSWVQDLVTFIWNECPNKINHKPTFFRRKGGERPKILSF